MKTKRCWPSGMLVPDDEQPSRQVDALVSVRPLMIKILREFQHIQRSHKGSIGSIQNTYLPQLDVIYIDRLTKEIQDWLEAH